MNTAYSETVRDSILSAPLTVEAYANFGAAISGILNGCPSKLSASAVIAMRVYKATLDERLLKGAK